MNGITRKKNYARCYVRMFDCKIIQNYNIFSHHRVDLNNLDLLLALITAIYLEYLEVTASGASR